ncbi:MAG TPA: outer membrane lipoprotein-sorting protein [Chthonomonadales bacterium]|nr:outer membrane lipoprotein-sorting protein [Chthonomonadales bacterium]
MPRLRLALPALVLVVAAEGALAVPTDIRSYVCQRLDDFTATLVVVRADQRQLSLISRDAGFLYRFRSVTMRYKEPNKVRIDINEQGTRGTYIVNGPIQLVSVPKLGLRTRRDFSDSPGKRKSLMDVGLVSEHFLTYANARFVRRGTVDGTPVGVFELTYKDRDADTSHHIIYIDPVRRVVLKRENYTQEGKLQAIYHFRNPREVSPGIWFPTRIEAQNVNGVIAGITEYRNIRVNTGLSDSLFTL